MFTTRKAGSPIDLCWETSKHCRTVMATGLLPVMSPTNSVKLQIRNCTIPHIHNISSTNILHSRSNGAVDTSTKACLTSVAIRIQIHIHNPDHQQNLTIWPIANLLWKFHANPFRSFCTKLLTDRQTDRQWQLHNLLGRGNNYLYPLVHTNNAKLLFLQIHNNKY